VEIPPSLDIPSTKMMGYWRELVVAGKSLMIFLHASFPSVVEFWQLPSQLHSSAGGRRCPLFHLLR